MKDKLTIWCISKYASPPEYGVGSKLFNTAKHFSEMGAEVVLISSDSNHLSKYPETKKRYNYEKYGNLLHIWIKGIKYDRSASMKRILSWFDFENKLFWLNKRKLNKPDIVIVSSLSLLTVLNGIWLKRRYNCKLVFEVRDIHPLTLTEELGVGRRNPLVIFLGIIEKAGYKKADLIVGTMPNLKKHVEEILGYQKDVYYSPIGIHTSWSKEIEKNSNIDSLFPKTQQFIIGYAGSMGKSNALDNFIESIEHMADNTEVYFVIVGDGDLKESYINRLKSLKNVTIGPKIKQGEVPYFLSKCNLLYLSTHDSKVWKYGQSMNKLLDYMMAGKPVVASYSGYPSMLNEAGSGVFVRTMDTEAVIEQFLKYKNMSQEELSELGTKGKVWVQENHNYNTIAKRYFDKLMEFYGSQYTK